MTIAINIIEFIHSFYYITNLTFIKKVKMIKISKKYK